MGPGTLWRKFISAIGENRNVDQTVSCGQVMLSISCVHITADSVTFSSTLPPLHRHTQLEDSTYSSLTQSGESTLFHENLGHEQIKTSEVIPCLTDYQKI